MRWEEAFKKYKAWRDLGYGHSTMPSSEVLVMAMDALYPITRERVEKVWKGEWRPTEYPYMNECEDCSVCEYRAAWGHGFRFCPNCGAPMTDEAVQMVMERMDAIR